MRSRKRELFLGFTIAFVLLLGIGAFRSKRASEPRVGSRAANARPLTVKTAQTRTPTTWSPQVEQSLPLTFEPNHGQSASWVKFLAHGRGYRISLGSSGAELSVRKKQPMLHDLRKTRLQAPRRHISGAASSVRIKMEGSRPDAPMSPLDPVAEKSNYFVGKDPSRWRTNIPHFLTVRYSNIYPAVDLVYHGSNQGQLEFDFVAAGRLPRCYPSEV
jgi:hypothetical protein